MRLIDNGKFFIKPQKWWYFLLGVLAFVIPLLVTYKLGEMAIDTFRTSREVYNSELEGAIVRKAVEESGFKETWKGIVGVIGIILFLIYQYVIAFVIFYFWKSRIKNLDSHVKVGDNIVALPLLAHSVKCIGEVLGVYIGLIPPVAGIFLYIFCLLTGENDFYKEWNFVLYLLMLALAIVVCIMLAWFIIFIFRVFSERITLRPQIANDVRDMGDIHRAAVMQEETKNIEEA